MASVADKAGVAQQSPDYTAGPEVTVQETAIRGVTVFTPSDLVASNVTPGRQLIINCTIAGNVSMVFGDDSVLVLPIVAGLTLLPFRIRRINSTNTTATATYYRGV